MAKEREALEKEKIAKAREEMLKEKEKARREATLMMQHDKPKPCKVKSLTPTTVPPPPPVLVSETAPAHNHVIESAPADIMVSASDPVIASKCEAVNTDNENREKAKIRMLEYIQREKLRKKLLEDEKLAIEKKRTEVLQRAAVIISRAASAHAAVIISRAASAPKTKGPQNGNKVETDENINPNHQQSIPLDQGKGNASKPSTSHSTKSGKSSVISNGASKKNKKYMKGLAASPYFSSADYQAIIQKHSIQSSKKRSKKLGKVASLLQLVSKARQKISTDLYNEEPLNSDYIHEDMSIVSDLSAVDTTKHGILPHSISSFFSSHKPPTLAIDSNSNIVKILKESDYDAATGDNNIPRANDDDDYEDQLNKECELLRQRLEAKINKEAKDRVLHKQKSVAMDICDSGTPLSNIYNYNINEHNETNEDDSLYSGLDSFIYTDNDIDNDNETVYSFFRKDEAQEPEPMEYGEGEDHTLEPQSYLSYDDLVAKEFEELRNKILTNRSIYAIE